jgi:hypothetical protein
MGRPIGSQNKEKPFNDALRMALRNRPLSLRRVADQLLDKAEQGNLAYIHELIDRLDGKPAQVIDRQDVPLEKLSDAELYAIANGGYSREEHKMLLITPAKVTSGEPE